MSEKPEALRLADVMDDGTGRHVQWVSVKELSKAAAELRRLHADNERLREALKKYSRHLGDCALEWGGYQCTCGFNQQEPPR